ncbi:glycosyltransferase family 15 protein [Roridomyces roridus]|uniref:Glycosyltransferase family 15 protein n=1 Tax=Roridomyces roridus TaxID=1738132 RepID=A0AAD7FG03_9AGAR|nr:glycosyltransferase family 15 protein [Roridomyces roridus]
MHQRARYATLSCIILMSFVALYRKYSSILTVDDAQGLEFPGLEGEYTIMHPTLIPDPPPRPLPPVPLERGSDGPRANATFIILARNSDLQGALLSVRQLEDRFNRRYHYPYVFLNEEEFTEDFKRRIRNLTPSKVEFGLIPKEAWFQPEWIDAEKAQAAMVRMERANVKYGGNLAYHNMCRFNSGFFFKHPLVLQYEWYWRVEPNIKFHCDIIDDPFMYMVQNNKTYGFTLSVYEIPATIKNLWLTVKDFMTEYPEYILPSSVNALDFISNDGGRSYNRCHFWSNFEIASLGFWRSEAYTAFFEFLDKTGGFYYERWGDAPVHSIAAALMLPRSSIHLFEEIGYQHDDWSHCPRSQELWERGRCLCTEKDSFDYSWDSCRPKWDSLVATG